MVNKFRDQNSYYILDNDASDTPKNPETVAILNSQVTFVYYQISTILHLILQTF